MLKIPYNKDYMIIGLNKATDTGIMDVKVGPRAIQLKNFCGNSLVVQWLGLGAFIAEGLGSIPGQGNKISQAGLPWWHSG